MNLQDNKEFFRYLVSKIVQTTPSTASSDEYAEQVFQRAVKVFEKVRDYEWNRTTNGH